MGKVTSIAHRLRVAVEGRDEAQLEIIRLNKLLANDADRVSVISVQKANRELRKQYKAMLKQRDELWSCLKPRLERDGIIGGA